MHDINSMMQFSIWLQVNAPSGIGFRVFACLFQPHGKSIEAKLDEDHHFIFRGLGLFTDDVVRIFLTWKALVVLRGCVIVTGTRGMPFK